MTPKAGLSASIPEITASLALLLLIFSHFFNFLQPLSLWVTLALFFFFLGFSLSYIFFKELSFFFRLSWSCILSIMLAPYVSYLISFFNLRFWNIMFPLLIFFTSIFLIKQRVPQTTDSNFRPRISTWHFLFLLAVIFVILSIIYNYDLSAFRRTSEGLWIREHHGLDNAFRFSQMIRLLETASNTSNPYASGTKIIVGSGWVSLIAAISGSSRLPIEDVLPFASAITKIGFVLSIYVCSYFITRRTGIATVFTFLYSFTYTPYYGELSRVSPSLDSFFLKFTPKYGGIWAWLPFNLLTHLFGCEQMVALMQMMASFYFFLLLLQTHQMRYAVIIGLLINCLLVTHQATAVGMVCLYAGLGLVEFFRDQKLLRNLQKSLILRDIGRSLLFSILFGLPVLFQLLLMMKEQHLTYLLVFPANMSLLFGAGNVLLIENYVSILWVPAFVFLLKIRSLWMRRRTDLWMRLSFIWIVSLLISPFLLRDVYDQYISKTALFMFIPVTLMASMTIVEELKAHPSWKWLSKSLYLTGVTFLLFSSVYFSLPLTREYIALMLRGFISGERNRTTSLSRYHLIPQIEEETIRWIRMNTSDKEVFVILPQYQYGTNKMEPYAFQHSLPTFSGRSVVIASAINWYAPSLTIPQIEERIHDSLRIFELFDQGDIMKLIKKWDISYIYAGIEEHRKFGTLEKFEGYPFLTKVFDNKSIQIYRVKKVK